MPKYRVGQAVWFPDTCLAVRRAVITSVRGGLYTLRYRATNGYDSGAIRLREGRIYATREEAQAALRPFRLPEREPPKKCEGRVVYDASGWHYTYG